MPNKPAELMVEQDLKFQTTVWKIQRFGWIIMTVLLAIAALGYAGGIGPLNKAKVANGQVEVEYKPYIRRSAPTELNLTISSEKSEAVKVQIGEQYLSKFNVQDIVPQPVSVIAGTGQIEYQFTKSTAASSVDVSFSLKAKEETIGNIEGSIFQSVDSPIKFRQVVYP